MLSLFRPQTAALTVCACLFQLPGGGVSLTLAELQDMAARQQQQLEVQHQLLSAREQRLHFLKHGPAGPAGQGQGQGLGQADGERLRRLRERVEAQEQKLRKLRALRGQVDGNKQSNAALSKYSVVDLEILSMTHSQPSLLYPNPTCEP